MGVGMIRKCSRLPIMRQRANWTCCKILPCCGRDGRTPMLALDDVDLDGLDGYADFFQPLDGGLDVGAVAVQFKADDADLVRDAGLADIGDYGELVAELPDYWSAA